MIAEAIPREMILEEIPLELIDIGSNIRVDPGELEEMASSIRELGVLQPVKVGPPVGGRYLLLWGQRRVLASRLAGKTTIPAIVDETDNRPIEQLVENLQRADLNPIEEANALRDVLAGDRKLTQAALAEKLGRSQAWIANTLGLLKAPELIRTAIVEGKLTASHAKAVSGLTPKKAEELAKKAIAGNYSAHDLERDAKWEAQRQRDLDKRSKETEAAATKAIAALRSAEVPDYVSVQIRNSWELDSDRIQKLVKAAGFNVADGYGIERPKGCDCTAVRVEVAEGKGTKVTDICLNDVHRKAADEGRRAEYAAQAAELKKDEAVAAKALKAALKAQPPHPVVLRLLLRGIDGYSSRKWSDLGKLTDAAAIDELATKLAGRLGQNYGGNELPIKVVLASLGGNAE